MKKFTGLLAIITLLIFSYNEKHPASSMGKYAGEFHIKNEQEKILNEKDIIINDDTTILVISQQLRK